MIVDGEKALICCMILILKNKNELFVSGLNNNE